jgi:hypothetical protein
MKMHFVLAALMMTFSAAGCSTLPASQDQATVTSEVRGDVPATVESSDIAATTTSDSTSDSTLPADPTGGSAPSSLGASSSGRGH